MTKTLNKKEFFKLQKYKRIEKDFNTKSSYSIWHLLFYLVVFFLNSILLGFSLLFLLRSDFLPPIFFEIYIYSINSWLGNLVFPLCLLVYLLLMMVLLNKLFENKTLSWFSSRDIKIPWKVVSKKIVKFLFYWFFILALCDYLYFHYIVYENSSLFFNPTLVRIQELFANGWWKYFNNSQIPLGAFLHVGVIFDSLGNALVVASLSWILTLFLLVFLGATSFAELIVVDLSKNNASIFKRENNLQEYKDYLRYSSYHYSYTTSVEKYLNFLMKATIYFKLDYIHNTVEDLEKEVFEQLKKEKIQEIEAVKLFELSKADEARANSLYLENQTLKDQIEKLTVENRNLRNQEKQLDFFDENHSTWQNNQTPFATNLRLARLNQGFTQEVKVTQAVPIPKPQVKTQVVDTGPKPNDGIFANSKPAPVVKKAKIEEFDLDEFLKQEATQSIKLEPEFEEVRPLFAPKPVKETKKTVEELNREALEKQEFYNWLEEKNSSKVGLFKPRKLGDTSLGMVHESDGILRDDVNPKNFQPKNQRMQPKQKGHYTYSDEKLQKITNEIDVSDFLVDDN